MADDQKIVKAEDAAERLYDEASKIALMSRPDDNNNGAPKIFSQHELLALDIAHNTADLMQLCTQLYGLKLVRYITKEGKLCFQLRSRMIASKLRTVNSEENMIYEQIEETGETGQWIKTLKQKTGITVQTTLNKAIKTLEQKELVKQIKTVRNPTQKTYILFHFTPGESVTGGPWHADGELDTELIDIVSETVVAWIDKTCWGGMKRVKRAGSRKETEESKKRKREGASGDIEGVHNKSRRVTEDDETRSQYLWRPADWHHYPTAAAIHHFVAESGFVRKHLEESDIITLLDTLVYSERIEKVNQGYRTIRGQNHTSKSLANMMAGAADGEGASEAEGTGLTQAPCGRCPVFELCQPGGPVNANNCPYFETWLRT